MFSLVTYTHELSSSEDIIGYNYAKIFGLDGKYYSVVYFLLLNNYQVVGWEDYIHEMRIEDLCYLYLKDGDTMYASNGVIVYQLDKIS